MEFSLCWLIWVCRGYSHTPVYFFLLFGKTGSLIAQVGLELTSSQGFEPLNLSPSLSSAQILDKGYHTLFIVGFFQFFIYLK